MLEPVYAIYGTKTCTFCMRAIELLESNEISFKYTDLTEMFPEEKEELMKIAGKRFETVPQIFEYTDQGFKYIGGFTELDNKLMLERGSI